ncbi:plasmid mobilization relaxosome protein MobC [Nonomuraea sp. NPDC049695]|uniref:plasmid mobilization relaxosome protein MobC n=1 Tax=Nonomuraea sp. NPDC049695 TaxID=3154734 RepID=UPI00343E3772
MGRRRGRADSPRDNRVGPLFLSDRELAALKLAAQREGLDVGAFAALAAVSAAEQRLTLVPLNRRQEMAEFVQTRVALNRIGNNLNQVARALNRGDAASEAEAVVQLVGRAIRRVEAAADQVARSRSPE